MNSIDQSPSDVALIAELHKLLEKHYALDGTLTSLPGDRDSNFQLNCSTGEKYVVKLMDATYSERAVSFQVEALLHLQSSNNELVLPCVCPALSGGHWLLVNIESETRILWALSWCEGQLLARFSPRHGELAYSFGGLLAQLNCHLADFTHPAMKDGHHWELTRALDHKERLSAIAGDTQTLARNTLEQFQSKLERISESLRWGVVHNDANDYNVLVDVSSDGEYSGPRVTGIFDFGDMSYQPVVFDAAIALAYLVLDELDPLRVCRDFLRGYAEVNPLTEDEVDLLFTLIKTRLAVSIAISSARQLEEPDDPYIVISQKPAIDALTRLDAIANDLATAQFRQACGLNVVAQADKAIAWLASQQEKLAPVIVHRDEFHPIDLSIGSLLLGANPANAELVPLTTLINKDMQTAGVSVAYGRYGEPRGIYDTPAFGASEYPTQERRTEHLGVDIFCAPGTPVHAPLKATVECIHNNVGALDYGPLVILRHEPDRCPPVYSLYGHLALDSVSTLEPGQLLHPGEMFARVGNADENGGWTPHLHIQLILDLLALNENFPGVAKPSDSPFWRALCPSPAWLLKDRSCEELDGQPASEHLHSQREQFLGSSLSLSYNAPLHIVRGYRQFLYDSQARAYLDLYNNVAHVGHSHPRVINAVAKQTALLNTNTRYLHNNIVNYAQRLTATLPDELDTCFFVNSASEANELALRLAQTYTRRKDMLVIEAAYHGHTSALVELSPYKYNGPGGQGSSDWVHEVPLADDYRGEFRRDQHNAGTLYADALNEVLVTAQTSGRGVAGFIAETLPSVGGQIQFPAGYLAESYSHVRAAGGLCIADEVQVGFGRLGDCFWGFESESVIPDIVVLGKPIANGYPLGAVITRRDIANRFDNGMEFFSTFGGNPVACAAGLAVLDVLEEEQLQNNAKVNGALLADGLRALQKQYPVIGDVRGRGFFLGIELVRSVDTLEPAAGEARYLVNRMRERGILLGTDGPLHNVIKLRPTMVTNSQDINVFLEVLEQALQEISL
ncbi:MAG: aminotransferase class III-fold pyridoxal phosphate-dependent enzyme [Halioglobus sp.]